MRQALGLRGDAGGHEVSRKLGDLLVQAEESTGRAQNFFREIGRESLASLEGRHLSCETARNLEVALQVSAFRHYLGASVLDWVAHHL
jgi:hypothetical protein